MSNNISINRITNANVYVDGRSFLGRAEEMTPPVVKFKYADHKASGMFGEMEYASGIEKMEAKVKWNSLYPEVLKKISNPFEAVNLQFRSTIDVYEASSRVAQKPLIIYLRTNAKELPLGVFKPQESVEAESSFAVSYFKLEIDGEVITEVDVEANIWIVDGVDLLAQYRENLGI